MSANAAIDVGADVNYSNDGESCLVIASYYGYAKMVTLLLHAGANKETKGEDGFTTLSAAAQDGHAECVQLLLNAGADADA
jgi:ankyrin repeat protein